MAFDRTSIRLRFLGHFGATGSSLDQWSSGLRLGLIGGGEVPGGDYTVFLESISTAVAAFHSSTGIKAGSTCFLDSLTAAKLGTDGKYVSAVSATYVRDYSSPVAGNGTSIHPWNTAFVVSQRTPFKRGYASNGRMYWPACGLTVQADTGRLSDSNVSSAIGAAKTMFDAINAASVSSLGGATIMVMSSVGAGLSGKVISLRGDQRLDSIERRENNQPAIWYSQNLA